VKDGLRGGDGVAAALFGDDESHRRLTVQASVLTRFGVAVSDGGDLTEGDGGAVAAGEWYGCNIFGAGEPSETADGVFRVALFGDSGRKVQVFFCQTADDLRK